MAGIPQPFSLEGKVAVVTGGGNGIGRATSEVLAQAGASVVVGDIDDAAASEVAAGIQADGGSALAVAVDTGSKASVDALVDRAVSEYGGLDIMCNVAGVYARRGNLVDMDEAELDRVIQVNLKGVVFGSQAAVGAMTARGGGAIVNVASSIIDIPAAGNALYAMTKAGVTTLSRVLAEEVGPLGIRVNVIAPGPTVTDFVRHNAVDDAGQFDEGRWSAFLEKMESITPLRIVGEALDQAYLILYLVAPASRLATGNVFRVNGGLARPG